MDELTLIELHLGGLTFGSTADETDSLDTQSIIGTEEETETTSAEIETAHAKRGLGQRIGRALALTVVLAVIGRAVVGRVRSTDTDMESESHDDPEVVSVDTAVADEN